MIAAPVLAEEPSEEAGVPDSGETPKRWWDNWNVEQFEDADPGDDVPIMDNMKKYCDRGGTSLTLMQLNKIRRDLVDAAGEYVKEDGTVVPAVWNKIRVLTATYSAGVDADSECGLDYVRFIFGDDEDLGAKYLEMPMGKEFTFLEYADVSGRDPEECKEICEEMAQRGLLFPARRRAQTLYHQAPFAVGFTEYFIPHEYDDDYLQVLHGDYLNVGNPGLLSAGSPLYFAIPCNEDIVADERIIPCQDYREIVDRYDTAIVLPCHCSLHASNYKGYDVPGFDSPELQDYLLPDCGHHLERCMCFGESAEHYLQMGIGRQVNKEEALEILRRNVDEGLVLQSSFVRDAQIICSCHSDCCGTLGCYRNIEPLENWESSPIKYNCSSYLLNYDRDSCIKCLACVERCPMRAIDIDDDGYPTMNTYCIRCGQCAYICPAKTRSLTERPVEDRIDIPVSHIDAWNRMFGYRVEHGKI